MTPYHRMEEWYRTHPGLRPFDQYVDMHHQAGVVVASAEFFVMGRAVSSKANAWRINESMQVWPRPQQDAWYIFAMAGDLRRVWGALPYELPLICFNRHGQKNLRFYSLPRIRDLCGQLIPE